MGNLKWLASFASSTSYPKSWRIVGQWHQHWWMGLYTSHVYQQDVMSLVFRLLKITAYNGHSTDMTEVRWTASPTSVDSYMCWIGLLTHNCQVDCLQANAYNCGVWVLASIAVLCVFEVMGSARLIYHGLDNLGRAVCNSRTLARHHNLYLIFR